MALRIRNVFTRYPISNIRCCSSKPPENNDEKLPTTTTDKPGKITSLPPRSKCHIAPFKTEAELLKIPYTSTLTSHYKNPQNLVKIPYVKPFESTYVANRPIEDPLERSLDMLKPMDKRKTKYYIEGYTAYYDIVIMGGGVMGCSIAYWLANRVHNGFKILVIERDPTVSFNSFVVYLQKNS